MSTTIGPLEKQVATNLPYQFIFTDWTVFDTYPITSATVTGSPSGLTIGSPTINAAGDIVTVRISAGTSGVTYRVTCLVSTASGYQDEVSFDLKVN